MAGQPPKYDDPEKLQAAIDTYFNEVSKEDPATITGLAYHLGFESRQSFYDYEERELFSYTIKRARMRIENVYEKNLHGNACTGSIFALKNMGWKDKHEADVNHTGGVQLIFQDAQGCDPIDYETKAR